MTKNQRVTAWIIFAAVVALLAYDTFAYLHGGVAATISWVLWSQGKDYPIIPFAVGLLCGHLFGQMSVKKNGN